MKHSIEEIAINFANGEFDKTSDHLNENIIWNVVGESKFKGISYCAAIIEFQEYNFNS
ncbi:hypothetical protein [Brumimicrobium glaciale]|uniref:hypothetical protein n=1 Tax=Brumimicrobium glaciale TaxID=200475 RepID=UPI0013ED95F5|nr:hypothetical protein [Brumimicrobium glaciale]